MDIRIANLLDIEKIMVLEEQAFKLHSEARPDLIGKHTVNIKGIIEDNNREVFVVDNENEIIGFCIVSVFEIKNHFMYPDMTNIEIDDFCVDEKYRQKGIGKKLFEKVKLYAKEKRAQYITLTVWDFNKNAKNFYEHLGMKTRTNRMELKVESTTSP
ncbi:MAG: GNAT family N-acetyltransferase [Treponema sp.]|nr:GNAT family N-acetyltransferase [Treponema sp.]